MPLGGFRVDSGANLFSEISIDTQSINDVAKKSIVRKLGEVKLPTYGLVKFSDMTKHERI